MKAFIAYRFSGEDPKIIEPALTAVRDGLNFQKIDSYCTFFNDLPDRDKNGTAKAIMLHAFKEIEQSDFLFVLQTSEAKSEGMLMEVGYCLAKQIPIVVANCRGVRSSYIHLLANKHFDWEDVLDLTDKTANLDYSF